MNASIIIIKQEFHIIHKMKDGRPEFHMDVNRRRGDKGTSFHAPQDLDQTSKTLLTRSFIGKRGHGYLRVLTLGRDAVRGIGAG